MLSVGILKPGRADYYVSTVATGLEDYYAGSGEAPGQWTGRASELLGLEGEVDGADLTAVLASLDPVTGERLTRMVLIGSLLVPVNGIYEICPPGVASFKDPAQSIALFAVEISAVF